MTALIIVLLLAAVGAGAWLVFRRGAAGADPDCDVARAWDRFVSGGDAKSKQERDGAQYLAGLDPERSARLRKRLQKIEHRFEGSEGRTALRETIMDLTDRAMFAQAMIERQRADGEEVDDQLIEMSQDGLAQAGVLRCLAGLKFADRAAEDWYTHYMKLARLNVTNVATMVERTTHGDRPELESSLHTPLSNTMGQMREELLQHPPRQPVRTHSAIAVEAVHADSADTLSPAQVEQLAALLRSRINRIILGELYVDDDTVLEPGRAFEMDAAILYALLGDRMEDPDRDWRRVIELAFQSFEGDALLSDLDRMLERGRELRGVWQANPDDGPLQRVVEHGYMAARVESSSPDHRASPPLRVVEDAGDLLRDLQAILGRS